MNYDISIITPTLNARKVIKNCISSVSCQRGIRIQHIVVDGGSTDGTIEILVKSKVKYIVLRGSSIYEALNCGIKNAQANLLGFLNADDTYTSVDVLLNIVQKYYENPHKCIIYGNCNFINTQNKLLYSLVPDKIMNYKINAIRVFNISHPCWFIDKKLIEQLNYYDTSLRFVSDCDLIIRALKIKANFIYMNITVANFTLHYSNASSSKSAGKEAKNYFRRINGYGLPVRVLNIILLILLYSKDFKYFIYRFSRIMKLLKERF